LQNLNKQIFSGGLKEQALLDAIGTEKQQMAQKMLDEAQTKYYDREEFARNELNKWYQSLLGNPIWKQPNYETAGQQYGGGPGMGKTLLSLAGIGLGLGGFKLPTFKGGGSIGGGLASMAQARPYMNYMRRNMGGKVMPPVVYRQTGGGELLDEDAAFQTGANRPVSDIVAAREAVEAAGMARGVDTLAPDSDGPAVAPPSILKKADIAAPETALPTPITSSYTTIEKFALGNTQQIARDKVAEATANRVANEEEIKGIRKLTKTFQKTQENRFNKYQDMVKKLVGDDPNANRKFWFTVAAAIGKPGGNAFTNMAEGFKQATLNADADRKEKNKMLMTLAKDEMDFMKDVDKLGFNSEIKLLGLTKKQQKELAGLDSSIRKAIVDELKITGDLKLADARLQEAKNKGKGDNIKSARVMNTISKRLMSEALQAYGYILGEDNTINQVPGNTVLYKDAKDKVMKLYLDMFDAYKAAKKDPVKGQIEAAKILRRHITGNPNPNNNNRPPPPAGASPR
jgi:hypothetical protein